MAKARNQVVGMTPDSLDEYESGPAVAVQEPPKVDDPVFVDRAALIEVQLRTVTVNAGYTSKHVDCQLTQLQAETLKELTRAAHDGHAKLMPTGRYPSGQHVDTPADAIRWLLEQLAGAAK